MDRIVIEGGRKLTGTLPISGSKNAVLPLMVASLLTPEKLHLVGTPRLADTHTLAQVLEVLGAQVSLVGTGKDEGIDIAVLDITETTAPYELVSKMRASFWVLGPLLARCGKARVSLPGGCAIGTRPVDLYLKGLAELGAELSVSEGYVNAKATAANGRLTGGRIDFPFVSVGATHVLMMAASLADGETIITNAATEPEVVDVGRCLLAMGAKIDGLGTRQLTIQGVRELKGTRHRVVRDRIEAGAYACAIAATHGDAVLGDADMDLLGALTPVLQKTGTTLTQEEGGLRITGSGQRAVSCDVVPEP